MTTTDSDVEIIFKQSFAYDGRLGDGTPIPAIFILANASGFRYLAEFFNMCAENADRLDELHPLAAIHEHHHLDVTWPPINYRLSDHFEIYVTMFNSNTREELLEKHKVHESTARRDDLISRYEDTIRRVRADMAK